MQNCGYKNIGEDLSQKVNKKFWKATFCLFKKLKILQNVIIKTQTDPNIIDKMKLEKLERKERKRVGGGREGRKEKERERSVTYFKIHLETDKQWI